MRKSLILIILLITPIFHLGNGLSIKENTNILISDGVKGGGNLEATTVTCEPIYGFLPCTTTFWGLLFMVIVYEILLMNGISGSSEAAQTSAGMSMGLLAGSTIISLTLIWGSVIAFGSHDFSDKDDTKAFTLTGYGVTTDDDTKTIARLVLISMIPFLILQLASVFHSSSGKHVVVFVSFVVSATILLVFCTYQVFRPWIQERGLEFVMRKYVMKRLLKDLYTAGNKPNKAFIKKIFHKIDQNNNTYLSKDELRTWILGVQTQGMFMDEDDFVEKFIKKFDFSSDSRLDEEEFVKGISKLLIEDEDSADGIGCGRQNRFQNNLKESTLEEHQSLITRKHGPKEADKAWLNYTRAGILLFLGTAISVVLSRPLIQTVGELSTAANIPSFFVSYVVIPLALNFRQAKGAITSAKRKTQQNISLTFSEIYTGVFMNNMVGLIIFLSLVFFRNLSWDVSAEVLVVLVICLVMGLCACFITRFPVWTSIVAVLLYPISLLMLYVLTAVLGWS
ncbi:hypothetical protein UlMin_017008 [Ulmus minor]